MMKPNFRTKRTKEIIKAIVLLRGFKGDYDKLKIHTNVSLSGNPKRLLIDGEVTKNVIAYYWHKNEIYTITKTDYSIESRQYNINEFLGEKNATIAKRKIKKRITIKDWLEANPQHKKYKVGYEFKNKHSKIYLDGFPDSRCRVKRRYVNEQLNLIVVYEIILDGEPFEESELILKPKKAL